MVKLAPAAEAVESIAMSAESPPPSGPARPPEKAPWRLSWVLIAILLYALLQTTYFVFFAEG
jgi:hypothetical protein